MYARLSVDTDLVHGYGDACELHASALDAVSVRLRAAGSGSVQTFGPVGASFLASLARATAAEASGLARLRGVLMAGTAAAASSARDYDAADVSVAARLPGGR
ncbi:ESX-1 secretion-associated protein [Mycolicibacterium parafortuitum]|uniref:ESX-1 secretion-associated protein n=1 Tax=Mycolicibacterium parafortuitum TaxID=39692 RepID=A0A375YHF7_MYCPF|nr:ESX-1 secretion-associated protein [Mycolicibacterium parafortuitum]ORB25037.1 ESX-1 secretion-associated protein [Mycolicibacterium parafortuitum]SRX80556.1 hypothetical protein MPP7335_02299 [Mycolicibacterium parafortuitum]